MLKTEEVYHDTEEFQRFGLQEYLKHAEEYLQGKRTIPVSRTKDFKEQPFFFTFADDLLKEFVKNQSCLKKPYEIAIKYGFRSHSRGGKNGIFYLRNTDFGLAADLSKLAKRNISQIVQDLTVEEKEVPYLEQIKIVHHEPSGKRVVGLLNTQNNRAIFLGHGRY